ncbi:MAG: hypothetical protein JO291_06150 [Acidimicrobiia bacterium]|nr:hypothetical protein [Acidimicrobiia bacterium]
MPDLGTRLRDYIDASADPVTLDEVTDLRLEPASPRRPLRWLAVAATLVVVAGVVAVFLAEHRSNPTRTLASESWLTPLGAEPSQPVVPAGWKVLDIDDVRLAVPRDWTVPLRGGCGATGVLIVPLPPPDLCSEWNKPRAGVVVEHGKATAFGPLAEQVTATITDSGQRRALESGAVRSTRGWREIRYGGVAVRIPPSWHHAQLGVANLERCGQGMFRVGAPPRFFLGDTRPVPHCDAVTALPIDAIGQGVWMRRATGELSQMRDLLTQGTIDGLRVAIGRPPDRYQDPSLDLLVDGGTEQVRISIGVGLDASTARAIIRSIHRSGP